MHYFFYQYKEFMDRIICILIKYEKIHLIKNPLNLNVLELIFRYLNYSRTYAFKLILLYIKFDRKKIDGLTGLNRQIRLTRQARDTYHESLIIK